MNDLVSRLRRYAGNLCVSTPAEMEAADYIEQQQKELEEQARLLGMSAEREADLLGKMERLQREIETEKVLSFRNQVAELEKQRDALLAAAKLIFKDGPVDTAFVALSQAIRKCEGETK